MNTKIIETVRHIFEARADNAETQDEYLAWTSAKDIFEYALADNLECLSQYDYLLTNEEKGEG